MLRHLTLIIFLLADLNAASAAAGKNGDVPGCHEVPETESYDCDSGPLAGREFITKDEAQEAFTAYNEKAKEEAAAAAAAAGISEPALGPLPAEEKSPPSLDHLVVISWNMHSQKQETAEYDRTAVVLGGADLVALQEVDLRGKGKGFINILAELMQRKTKEKICRAWVHGGDGERQNYAFLWKESRIGYLDENGEMKETCTNNAVLIRQTSRNKLASQGTFIFKQQHKMFVLGTTFAAEKPATPDKHVQSVFRLFNEGKFPVLIAGDLKLNIANSAFDAVKKKGFHPAITGKRKGQDNFWFRGATLENASTIDLYTRFPDVKRSEIDKDFTGIFPIVAEFDLKEQVEHESVSFVKRKAAGKKR